VLTLVVLREVESRFLDPSASDDARDVEPHEGKRKATEDRR
jgi:hypothetical protein